MSSLPKNDICSSYFKTLKEVKVNYNSLIFYNGNQYSVPPKLIGKKIKRMIIGNELHIYYNGNFCCKHIISKNKINYIYEHGKILRNINVNDETSDQQPAVNVKIKVGTFFKIKLGSCVYFCYYISRRNYDSKCIF